MTWHDPFLISIAAEVRMNFGVKLLEIHGFSSEGYENLSAWSE